MMVLQLIIFRPLWNLTLFNQETMDMVTTGSCIGVTGKLVESMGKGQKVEIQATDI